MIEWGMILLGGMLGSSHCVGMCGGFALTLGSVQNRFLANLRRQLVYSAGRIATYTLAGALTGYGAWRMVFELRTVLNLQAMLAFLAGVLLIGQGLISLGVVRLGGARGGETSCSSARLFASLLTARDLRSVFVAGLLNGLLPCGLVYAYLALAASSGTMGLGAATMAVFGLGTVPIMVATGCGGALLSVRWRTGVLRVAAGCMILSGGLALWRGALLLAQSGLTEAPNCPLCH